MNSMKIEAFLDFGKRAEQDMGYRDADQQEFAQRVCRPAHLDIWVFFGKVAERL